MKVPIPFVIIISGILIMHLMLNRLSVLHAYFCNLYFSLKSSSYSHLITNISFNRYELQEDQSLLGEDEFAYDLDLVKNQINSCLEFWMGKREAGYPPMDELWKCKFCKFASVCPINSDLNDSPRKTVSEEIPSPDPTPK